MLDRQPGPALETSFANAGEISPGYASPWAAPGIPLKALKWLFMRHSPLFIRPTLSPSMLRFAIAMLRTCTAAAYAVNKSRMVPLAEYSRDMLRALRAETGLTYDERSQGTLQLFRTEKLFGGAAKDSCDGSNGAKEERDEHRAPGPPQRRDVRLEQDQEDRYGREHPPKIVPLDRAAFSRRRDDLKVGRTAPDRSPNLSSQAGDAADREGRPSAALFQADSGATPTTLRSCTRRLDCEGTWGLRSPVC